MNTMSLWSRLGEGLHLFVVMGACLDSVQNNQGELEISWRK